MHVAGNVLTVSCDDSFSGIPDFQNGTARWTGVTGQFIYTQ